VLEGRKIFSYIGVMLFCITQVIRFMPFYNLPGMTIESGWSAPKHSPLLFVLTVVLFCVGTIIRRHPVVVMLMQLSALFITLFLENIYIEFAEYKIKWLSYGFWIYFCLIIINFIFSIFENIRLYNGLLKED
jgi:hypothetical protein